MNDRLSGFCNLWRTFAVLVFSVVFISSAHGAEVFSIASYNVENLFDGVDNGREYPDYRSPAWTPFLYRQKLTRIARVLVDLDADIIGLQEVESKAVLDDLNAAISRGTIREYPFRVIADNGRSSVSCALMSRFPVIRSRKLFVGDRQRDILHAELSVHGRPLEIFVNHWRSRRSPESTRIASARVLKSALKSLPLESDVVILGDFNTDYDGVRYLASHPEQNDTGGVSGLCQMLGSWHEGRPVDRKQLTADPEKRLLCNLWLELPEGLRWSHEYYGHRSSLDAVLVTFGLFDNRGLSYVPGSFSVFAPDYLFAASGKVRRWKAEDGTGYSDHLPIVATLSVGGFKDDLRVSSVFSDRFTPVSGSIARLYQLPAGRCRVVIPRCAVILNAGDHAVLKVLNGRAIHVYKAARHLKIGALYRLTVTGVGDWHGLRQVTGLSDPELLGMVPDLSVYQVNADLSDLKKSTYIGEVAATVAGRFISGYLYEDTGERMHIYARKSGGLSAFQGKRVMLEQVRVGCFDGEPELVIETTSRIRLVR